MKVGFTGTRLGMTDLQKKSFTELLSLLDADEFHHGDCVGADDEAANIAADLAKKIVCHPPLDESLCAHNICFSEKRAPNTHLARNREIVHETDMLVGCPADLVEMPTGGTFYTIRYAKKNHKQVIVVWPDGKVEDFDPDQADLVAMD